jgi:hypothetical protein
MTIEYTFEVASVDAQARCMEIIYAAAGHPTMRIGARLPYEGETLETVVAMFAPIRYWEELSTPVSVPQVGQTGTITPSAPAEPTPSTVIESKLIDL